MPPDTHTTDLHFHSTREECWYVRGGSGIARIGDEAHELRPGSFWLRRPNGGVGHRIEVGPAGMDLVTMGDLVQQAVTQQDYSLTGGILAVGTFALLTAALSWLQYRVPRARPAATGRPLLVVADGRPIEEAMQRQRLALEDLLVSAREQGIRRTSEIEYAVLEADGRISFFTREGSKDGAGEKPPAGG